MKFAVFEGEKFLALCESRPMVSDRIFLTGDRDNYYLWVDLVKGYQVYALLGTGGQVPPVEVHVDAKSQPLPETYRQWYGLMTRCAQVDLSPAAVWSGEGKPPVGCECEVFEGPTIEWSAEQLPWLGQSVKVLGHAVNSLGQAMVTVENGKGECVCFIADCFRPLRTAEQLAAEARAAEIDRLCKVVMAHPAYQDHNRDIQCSAAMRLAVEAIVDNQKFAADA